MNPEFQTTCRSEGDVTIHTVLRDGRTFGYLVIDSVIAGRSCGGVRIAPNVSEQEVRGLARGMTLKFGIAGLPQGGAKAGICGDGDGPPEQRQETLLQFGRAILPILRDRQGSPNVTHGVWSRLQSRYIGIGDFGPRFAPGADMGTSAQDIRTMLTQLGLRVYSRELRGNDSGYFTAVSVLAGAKKSTRHLGMDLAGCRVAIEGFGKVGSALCDLLASKGAKVVAISTSRGAIYNAQGLDARELTDLANRDGSRVVETYERADRISCDALLELPVDLLCPCARQDRITPDNAAHLNCKIICAGANNPVLAEAEPILAERGILVLPYFATNCGGVLGGTMQFASIPSPWITAFILDRVGRLIAEILTRAEQRRLLPTAVAETMAMERFAAVKRAAETPSLRGKILSAGLSLHRRGLIPSWLMAPLAQRHFEGLFRPSEKP